MAIAHFVPNQGYTTTTTPINPGLPTTLTRTATTGTQVMSVAQALGGVLVCNTTDAGTLNFPAAADLAAGIQGVHVGTAVLLTILNNGDSTLTVGVGTGGTLFTGTTATQATVTVKQWIAVFTNVTSGSEAYTLYPTSFGGVY